MCLPVRAGTFSLGCGTCLKVPPTVGALPRILDKTKKKNMQEEIRMDKYFSSFLLVFPMSVWHDRVMSKLVFRSGCDKCKGGCVSGGPMAHGRERKEM